MNLSAHTSLRRFATLNIFLLLIVYGQQATGQTVAGNRQRFDTSNDDASTTESLPRHIDLDGQPNFRDLGGYATSDGKRVRLGQVYRSGDLSQLTERDVKELERLGIRTVVSFLTEAEVKRNGPDRVPQGTKLIPLAMETGNMGDLARALVEARKTGDFSNVPPDLNPQIHRILVEEGKEHYAKLLRLIADPRNRPIVFHCSHGVHRTGTGAAILLSALGVDWNDIREDYVASNRFRAKETQREMQELKKLDAENRGIPVTDLDSTNLEAFYVLEGSYIDAVREEAVETHGSMNQYIQQALKISSDETVQLREELLETPE